MRQGWSIGGAIVGAMMLVSCAHVREDLRYAERLCKNQPMVGIIKGAKLELEAKREELKSATVKLGVERYEKLSQELKGYTAEWESLNEATNKSCLDWALCQYRFSTTPNACNEARDRMEERQEAARKFLERLKKLDVGVEDPSITNVVPMTLGTKLSGKEFGLDITVRNPTRNVLQLDEMRLQFSGPRGGGWLASVTPVSGTYTIVIDPQTGKAVIRAPGSPERYDAYTWFPSGCKADLFYVRSPIWQTIQPNDSDRFIVKITFPDDPCMQQTTFDHVKVYMSYNGKEALESSPASLTGGP